MKISLMIFIVGFFYSYVQNSYFGWNFFPMSESELITDGIKCLIFCLGFICWKLEEKKS
jgi:hypothetical protein